MSELILPEQPSVLTLLSSLRDVAVPWLLDRTVAVMAEHPLGTLRPLGTGILLAIADDVFLVSAAHVLARAVTHQLWVHPAANAPKMVPLEGVNVNTTENRDAVDFGFVRLPDATRSELAEVKQLVRLSEIDMNPDDSAGWYAACGFPAELTSPSAGGPVAVKPFYYGTKLHDWSSKQPALRKFDRHLNVALEYAWRNSSDHVGSIAELPKPEGLSGCGLWRLFAYEAVRRGQWTTEAIRLVGIQHCHVAAKKKWKKNLGPKPRNHSAVSSLRSPRKGALLGVRLLHVVRTLRRAFPELGPAIDLHVLPPPQIVVVRDVD